MPLTDSISSLFVGSVPCCAGLFGGLVDEQSEEDLLVCEIVVSLKSVIVRMCDDSARPPLLRMRRDDEAIGRSLLTQRHFG